MTTNHERQNHRAPHKRNSTLVTNCLLLGMALLSSGVAGFVNPILWQHSLKVFLGGGEMTSSTLIVVVLMAGLGAGSLWMVSW